jgi:7,8-dihydroneopterin aldolase/epimerase/oxygenase
MDRILLEGMSFFGHHGVTPAEREVGAHFTVDVALELDVSEAGRTDRLEDTLDYRLAYDRVREVLEGDRRQLIEALAGQAAERLLALDRVLRATVTVRKRPPLPGATGTAGVEVTRSR